MRSGAKRSDDTEQRSDDTERHCVGSQTIALRRRVAYSGGAIRFRMKLTSPIRLRLQEEHAHWLDTLRGGAITSRQAAIRHVIAQAMAAAKGSEAGHDPR